MKWHLALLLCVGASIAYAQQTVRGTVLDGDTKSPVIGALVIFEKGDTLSSTATDINGKFRIENVALGRTTVRVSFMGYEDKVISNITVGAAKEVVLNIELSQGTTELEEVKIATSKKGNEVANDMSTSSARTFSVEETKRYAGSLNDPARMVSAFAGVTSNAEGDNDIVVRGNSPRGILWRLEGVEIPNPNHFAEEGQTGGPINALNSSMLGNSEFYSGAFSPEFGNAYSGVFDMKMRTGNNEKRETSFGIGFLGTDLTTEGPIGKKGKGSYLVNYRYSSLALLDQAGIVDFGGVPKYQDAAFKIRIPTSKVGIFSLFGLGGLSSIEQEILDDQDVLVEKARVGTSMGVVGLNHLYLINDKTYLKSSLSISGNRSDEAAESNYGMNTNYNTWFSLIEKAVYKGQSILTHKINRKSKFQLGAIYSQYTYNMKSEFNDGSNNKTTSFLNEKGDAGLAQVFASWKYNMNAKLVMVSGVHYTHFLLNNHNSIEPRVGFKYQVTRKQSLNAGFGIHSKLESFPTYFSMDSLNNQINKNLDFARAIHYVLGYSNNISENLFFKSELYYQQLDKVAVADDFNSYYSLINSSGSEFITKPLVNEGKGYNYGVELTLERYYAKSFFYMITASIYDSKYKAKDGVWRNTKYNGNYAGNVLFGKEFQIGDKEKNRVLGTSIKVILIGGARYTGIDLVASKAAEKTVWHDEPFKSKADDVFKLDVAVYYRKDKTKTTHEFKIDVQNATNNQAVTREWYDPVNQKIGQNTQLGLLPVISYIFSF